MQSHTAGGGDRGGLEAGMEKLSLWGMYLPLSGVASCPSDSSSMVQGRSDPFQHTGNRAALSSSCDLPQAYTEDILVLKHKAMDDLFCQ